MDVGRSFQDEQGPKVEMGKGVPRCRMKSSEVRKARAYSSEPSERGAAVDFSFKHSLFQANNQIPSSRTIRVGIPSQHPTSQYSTPREKGNAIQIGGDEDPRVDPALVMPMLSVDSFPTVNIGLVAAFSIEFGASTITGALRSLSASYLSNPILA